MPSARRVDRGRFSNKKTISESSPIVSEDFPNKVDTARLYATAVGAAGETADGGGMSETSNFLFFPFGAGSRGGVRL